MQIKSNLFFCSDYINVMFTFWNGSWNNDTSEDFSNYLIISEHDLTIVNTLNVVDIQHPCRLNRYLHCVPLVISSVRIIYQQLAEKFKRVCSHVTGGGTSSAPNHDRGRIFGGCVTTCRVRLFQLRPCWQESWSSCFLTSLH